MLNDEPMDFGFEALNDEEVESAKEQVPQLSVLAQAEAAMQATALVACMAQMAVRHPALAATAAAGYATARTCDYLSGTNNSPMVAGAIAGVASIGNPLAQGAVVNPVAGNNAWCSRMLFGATVLTALFASSAIALAAPTILAATVATTRCVITNASPRVEIANNLASAGNNVGASFSQALDSTRDAYNLAQTPVMVSI